MKTHKFPLLPLAAFFVLATALPMNAGIVYQDNFDNDGLATNTDTGGGISVAFANGTAGQTANWVDNGDLDAVFDDSTLARSSIYSTNAFDLSVGFTLTFTYTISDVTLDVSNANRVNIGLIDAGAFGGTSDTAANLRDIFRAGDYYGIGLNLTPSGDQGLVLADDAGAGSRTSLSNAQAISTGTHTLVLTLDDSSNWSYSIDGATATTGTIGGAGFDYSRSFNFYAYAQDDNNQIEIQGVTLEVDVTPVPEITSITVTGNTVELQITGDDGTDYYCASSTDLSGFTTEEAVFSDSGLTTPIASPFNTSGGSLTFYVDVTGDPRLFFRIQDTDPSP